jgi:hypothetical protein
MGVGAPHKGRINLARKRDVIGITAVALDQDRILAPMHRLANAELHLGRVGRSTAAGAI